MCIDLFERLYVLSISLQVAGALMLVKFLFYKGTRKNILKETISSKPDIDGGEHAENGIIFDLRIKEMRQCASTTYKNLIAFIYITLGYLLSVFGVTKAENRFCIAFCIVIDALLLLAVGLLLAYITAILLFRKDSSVILKDNGEIEEIPETEKKEL